MVLDRKKYIPVTSFSGCMILKAIAFQDSLLSFISSLLILGSAIFMGISIWREAPPKERTKQALTASAFCPIMWGVVYFLTPHIGNVLVVAICLMMAYCYIKKCPRFYINESN